MRALQRLLVILPIAAGILMIAPLVPPTTAAPVETGTAARDASGQQPGRRPEGLGRLGVGFGQLDLSDEQRAQIRAISQEHREAFQEIAVRMRRLRRGLREASTADPADEATLRERRAAVAAVEAEAAALRAGLQAELLAVLTPGQRERLEEIRAERERRQQERRQRFEQRRRQRREERPPQEGPRAPDAMRRPIRDGHLDAAGTPPFFHTGAVAVPTLSRLMG